MASRRVKRLQERRAEQTQAQLQISHKALGYVRVSTEEQATSGFGLEAQERAIRAFAESQGYELIDVVADAGVSGSTKPAERPGFGQVLALAQERAFSVLLVWKFDRLARNLTYAVTTANTLREQYGAVLRSVTEPIDTATPMGEMVFAVLAGMAAQERKSITERTLAGKKEKATKGGFAGGSAPLGYNRDKEGGLVINSTEAELVKRIYAMHKQGKSARAIATTLNAEGVPTKRGGRWYHGTVTYILDNKKYKGQVEYYFRWDGERYVCQEGTHEALF